MIVGALLLAVVAGSGDSSCTGAACAGTDRWRQRCVPDLARSCLPCRFAPWQPPGGVQRASRHLKYRRFQSTWSFIGGKGAHARAGKTHPARHPITWLATACREALDRGDFADSRILLCRVAHGTLAAGDARCS